MIAIYKRELKSYLTSMIGYIFIFFVLLFTGIYFTAYNLQSAYPIFGVTLSSITFIFLLAIPILTMRILAEERKQKTDQLLLTAPVSVKDIVLGKYFALITIFFIPIVIISFYPLILMQFGAVSLPMSYTALLGFFLLGCTDIAIGLFISSVTESQIISAILSFLTLFIFYIISGVSSFFSETALTSLIAYGALVLIAAIIIYVIIKNLFISVIAGLVGEIVLTVIYMIRPAVYEGAIQKLLGIFSVSDHLGNFIDGLLDLRGIVYFLSAIVICIFLTVQSVVKRRWS